MSLPLDSIVVAGKYISIFDQYGNSKVLDIPTGASFLIFDGTTFKWDNGQALGLPLGTVKVINTAGAIVQSLGAIQDGRLVSFAPVPSDHATAFIPVSLNGQIVWIAKDANLVPTTGTGIMVRQTVPSGDSPAAPIFLGGGGDVAGGKGLAYVNDDGNSVLLSNGAQNQVLTMRDGVPEFRDPSSGHVATGGVATSGLAGVSAANISSHSISLQAPTITVVNVAGETKTLVTVNVSADLAAAIGIGGLDTGAESANKWYYAFVTSDGATGVGLILSENPNAPDLSATTHTYWSFVSCFRNNAAADITPFIQRGRDFFTNLIVWGNAISSGTSFNAIPAGVSLASLIPPIVKTVTGVAGGSTGEAAKQLVIAGSATGLGYQSVTNTSTGSNLDGFAGDVGGFFKMPIVDPSAPALYWKTSANSARRRICITGYEI